MKVFNSPIIRHGFFELMVLKEDLEIVIALQNEVAGMLEEKVKSPKGKK